jgi:quinol monooxygenase YgiN
MAHVTTFRFRCLPGNQAALFSLFEKWAREERQNAPGIIEYSVFASNDDPNEFLSYVCFDSTENYKKNSDRPAQDAWYREFRALIEADPEWFNGTIAMAAASVD